MKNLSFEEMANLKGGECDHEGIWAGAALYFGALGVASAFIPGGQPAALLFSAAGWYIVYSCAH